MTTTIRTSTGHPATVELEKQGSEPLWNVHLVRGTGLAKESVQVGRIMRAGECLWYAERGYGWDSYPTRKAATVALVNHHVEN